MMWIFSACLILLMFVTTTKAENVTVRVGQGAFGDWTSDEPGVRRHITAADLPAPYNSTVGRARLTNRTDNVPKVKPGFAVDLFIGGLDGPRLLRTAPNGDIFVAEGSKNRIRILRTTTAGEVLNYTYADESKGLERPFGIAFFPAGVDDPTHVYIANTGSIIRFAYKTNDTQASGQPEVIIPDLPKGGHWTRDVVFSNDSRTVFVSVGSLSNVMENESDNETNRAMILRYDPNGQKFRQFATGIRNPVSVAIHPKTQDLWTSVNERDRLGDNLVPDYITRVKEGDFYGWPWYYIGKYIDPRHQDSHPDLQNTSKIPDVLIQAHSASLQMTFYTGQNFPEEYRHNAFAAQHGSWNRQNLTGYKVIRVLEKNGVPTGVYEDFVTGFITSEGKVWGRPVGVTIDKEGSLLISDDGSNSIWRVRYTGTGSRLIPFSLCSFLGTFVAFLMFSK